MSDTPPPVFARDYIRTAQITSLGYMAARLKTLPLEVNTTGDKLAEYISKTPEGKNFHSGDRCIIPLNRFAL
jgi:hypothetical protein